MAAGGERRRITLGGRTLDARFRVHRSGGGPGLLVLGDGGGLDDGLDARAALFGEEGYAVLGFDPRDAGDVVEAAAMLRALPECRGGIGAVGHGSGGLFACRAASAAGLAAVVAFDSPDPADLARAVPGAPCPVVLQFGTAGGGAGLTGLDRDDGSKVFEYTDAAPGFALPGRATFDKRVDGLAHSRSLEVLRRALGPHYDLVALFAAHVRHEFETRDVDATMATMIDEPYVNHVPTLAGGVGHDMLKRFYAHHFVHQNSRERASTLVSQTLGPDRIVLEQVVRFRHDTELDRYFPGIVPTGRMVEIPTLLFVRFRGDKVCHEHIYWDQGSALKQIGVLDAEGLPIAGPEAAAKVIDETRPSNIFMREAWASSEGKPVRGRAERELCAPDELC